MLNRRRITTLALLALPPVLYVFYSTLFAVNVPYWDDWLAIPLLQHLQEGHLSFAALYGGDNGQRALVPRTLGLAIAWATHFNTRATVFLTDAFIIGAYALFLSTLQKASNASTWVLLTAGFIFTSLCAYDVAIWASNMSWSVDLFCLVSVVWALQRARQNRSFFVLAFVLAIAGTFTSFQGLLIWVAGLAYVLVARFDIRRVVCWIVVAVLSVIVYSRNLSVSYGNPITNQQETPGYSAAHPVQALHIFVVVLGNVFSGTNVANGLPFLPLTLLGIAVLAAFVWLMIRACVARNGAVELASPSAFVVYALVFAASVAVSRSWMGLGVGVTPRYTLYILPALAALYVSVVQLLPFRTVAIVSTLLAYAQIVATAYLGFQSGRLWNTAYTDDVLATQHFGTAPVSLIADWTYWYPRQLQTVLAPEAEKLGISVFKYRLDPHPRCLANGTDAFPLRSYLSEDARRALTAAYTLAASPLGPPRWSDPAFRSRVLAWGITAASSSLWECLLPYADDYQMAYAVSLGDGDARNLLNHLYDARKELQYEYPSQLPRYEASLALWAARAPREEPYNPAWRALAPYRSDYESLARKFDKGQRTDADSLIQRKDETGWTLPIGFSFLHSLDQSYLGVWDEGSGEDLYADSQRIPVHEGATYEVGGTVDARYTSGPPPCFYLAEPNGYGFGITCARTGAREHYSQLVKIPRGVSSVVWVAHSNKTAIAMDKLLLYSDATLRPLTDAQTRSRMLGPTPQVQWYVPEPVRILSTNGVAMIVLDGDGQPTSDLYAHSTLQRVRSGAKYRLSAVIDARYASGRNPCIYVAELPSGRGFAMLCASNGRLKRYEEMLRIPHGIHAVAIVAFTNGTTVALNHRLSFQGISFERLSAR